MRLILALAATAALAGACTTAPVGGGASISTYATEYDALQATCTGRGGVLEPAGRGGTGRPATDYACVIRSGPSDRITR